MSDFPEKTTRLLGGKRILETAILCACKLLFCEFYIKREMHG